METSIVGVIYLILPILFILKYKKDIDSTYGLLILMSIFTHVFVSIGYVLKIGNFELLPFEFYMYLFFIINILYLFTKKYSKNQYLIIVFSFFAIALNIIAIIIRKEDIVAVVFPNTWEMYFTNGEIQTVALNKYVIINAVYLSMLPLTIINLKNMVKEKKIDSRKILLFFKKVTILLVFLGFVELFLKIIFDQTLIMQIRDYFFGISSYTVTYPISRLGLPMIMGLSKEPGHFVLAIFLGLLSYIVVLEKVSIKDNIFFLASIVLMLLTGSLLSIVYIVSFFVFYVLKFFKNHIIKHKKVFLCGAIGIVIISTTLFMILPVFEYFRERLLNIFTLLSGGSIAYSSESERITSTLLNLQLFLQYPIFGIGIGTTHAFSSISSLLSNFGVIGFSMIAYLFSYFVTIPKSKIYYTIFIFMIGIGMISGNGISDYIFPIFLLEIIIFREYIISYKKG